jgi:hypothetical protein
MSHPVLIWSGPEKIAWRAVYFALQEVGEEYYFSNHNGYARCKGEALAGEPRAIEVWAMYVAKRMTG